MTNLAQSLQPLFDRRFLTVFVLGFSSGFPWLLHGSVLTLWMQSEGLSRTEIGFIGAVAAVYALNWMWSPLIDELRLPWLYRLLGQRRSWIVFTQGLMIVAILLLSLGEPQDNLIYVGLCALGIAIASATQDIAVDAYRIMLFSRAEADAKMPFSSAVTIAGWYAGYTYIGGTLALALGGETIGLSWPAVYVVLAGVYVVLMGLILLSPEPLEREAEFVAPAAGARPSFGSWFRKYIAAPFTEFFRRCGFRLALAILLFLFLFRIGEAMLGRMSLVFYVELGFSTDEIALYNKLFGGLATVIFSLLGAVVNTRYGIIRGMLVGGIAMAAANLLYAVMATVGPEGWLFMLTLLVDNFCSAFATVAVISFMSYFASRTYTGTQFALMTSLSNFGRTTLSAGSGAIVDGMDGNWPLFFIFTTLAVIPALLLLIWVAKLLKEYQNRDPVAQQ
jgi:PAT family beta-lactamase induction signal transducer AmpG